MPAITAPPQDKPIKMLFMGDSSQGKTGALASLAAAGFHNAESLIGQYFAGPEDLRRFLGEGPILTDDRPMLEYYLSLPRDERPLDLSGLRHSPAR